MEVDSSSKTNIFEETSIIVQHDWFDVIKSPNSDKEYETFFIGSKKYGKASSFIDVKYKDQKVEYESPRFKSITQKSHSLYIEFDNLPQKTFLAPLASYGNLHKYAISSIDLSPTENLVVSAGGEDLLVWNSHNGKLLRSLDGHVMDITRAKFFPSGLVVLSGGMDMTVRIFSVETGQCARTLKGHRGTITDLVIIEKGIEVMSSSKDGTVKKWNCGRSESIQNWNLECGEISSLSLSLDDKLFVAGTRSGKIVLCDQRSNKMIHKFDHECDYNATYLSDKSIYAGTKDGDILCYDLGSRAFVSKIKTSRGSCLSLRETMHGLIASFSKFSLFDISSLDDGTVAAYPDIRTSPNSIIELSGVDCDPVYDFTAVGNTLFTACRDKYVRKYHLSRVVN